MSDVHLLLVGVPLIGLPILIAWVAMKGRARAVESWRAVARRRGARFEAPTSLVWGSGLGAMEVIVEQAVVLLDTYVVRGGRSSSAYTRARACFGAGAGPRFRVQREGMLGGLGKLLGAQDVVLGDDPAFDERFVVRCDDEGATRAAWTHRARRLLFAVEDARVESDGSTVSVVVGGHREDASTLEALLDLAGELASYGARELAAAAELPGARWIGPAGPWDQPRAPRVELESARGPIAVRCLPAAGRPALQLTLASARGLPTFSVDLAGGRLGGEAPRGLLPEGAAELLAQVGEATLSGNDRRVRLAFAAIPPPERVEAAARVLAAIAGGAPSLGAFR